MPTYCVCRSLQAAAAGGSSNGYAGGALSQKLAQLNAIGGGGQRGKSRLGGARTFEEIASGRAGSRESPGGGSGPLIGGLTRSMPTMQPLRATQRVSSRGGVSGGVALNNSSSSSAALSGSGSRNGSRQQPRLAFGEAAGGGEFRASIGGTGGRRAELSPIGSNGGGKRGESGGVTDSASVGAMPFLNAR